MTRTSVTGRRKWRLNSKLYLLAAVVVVSALIYWEQTALLYVVSTLAISVIMLIVAFANLERTDKEQQQASLTEQSEEVFTASERLRKRA